MGFMDKVRSAAQEVAVEAKKMGAQAQGKLSEAQLKRRMDDYAKQLGYLHYRERKQGVPAGADADWLVSEITALETQIEQVLADARAKQEAAQPSPAPPPPGGSQSPPPAPPPAPSTEPPPPPPQESP